MEEKHELDQAEAVAPSGSKDRGQCSASDSGPSRSRASLVVVASSPASASVTVGSGELNTAGSLHLLCDAPPCVTIQDKIDGAFVATPAGVITSWSVRNAVGTIALRVLRQRGNYVPGELHATNVSESADRTGSNADAVPQTFATRQPVKAGDYLGVVLQASSRVGAYAGAGDDDDNFEVPSGDVDVDDTIPDQYEQLLQVEVEPDADGDNYGDETQDACPTNRFTSGVCPRPIVAPVPIVTAGSLCFGEAGRAEDDPHAAVAAGRQDRRCQPDREERRRRDGEGQGSAVVETRRSQTSRHRIKTILGGRERQRDGKDQAFEEGPPRAPAQGPPRGDGYHHRQGRPRQELQAQDQAHREAVQEAGQDAARGKAQGTKRQLPGLLHGPQLWREPRPPLRRRQLRCPLRGREQRRPAVPSAERTRDMQQGTRHVGTIRPHRHSAAQRNGDFFSRSQRVGTTELEDFFEYAGKVNDNGTATGYLKRYHAWYQRGGDDFCSSGTRPWTAAQQ